MYTAAASASFTINRDESFDVPNFARVIAFFRHLVIITLAFVSQQTGTQRVNSTEDN